MISPVLVSWKARYPAQCLPTYRYLEKYSRNNMRLNSRQPPSDIQGSDIRSHPKEPKPSFIQISSKVRAYHQFQSTCGSRGGSSRVRASDISRKVAAPRDVQFYVGDSSSRGVVKLSRAPCTMRGKTQKERAERRRARPRESGHIVT